MAESIPEGLCYCRKCQKLLSENSFYDCVDNRLIDSNGKLSVCKNCISKLYDTFYEETGNLEKSIHKLCTSLNIKFSNEAASATQTHIQTLIEQGKAVKNVFGIYKSKLIAVNPSMDKSAEMDLTYSDVGTIYVDKEVEIEEIPIPQDVIDFWGSDITRENILYLEKEYTRFKATHKADTYAEIVLLKQVCYTMLDIKTIRASGGDTSDLVKELQALMKNLAISPNVANAANAANKGSEAFGLWIQDIEREEPAQWLLSDPRGDIYRDVADTESYFEKYFVRPLKNFIMGSKDFNVADDESPDDEFIIDKEDMVDYNLIDDGEV